MEIKRKQCIFCSKGKTFKSKEHVIPQWILEELDSRNTIQPFSETKADPKNLEFHRSLKYNKNYGNHVSPFVCDDCNHGWMSQLEARIKPLLLPLIKGTGSLNQLSKEDKILISRWAAKTSCVMNSVNQPSNSIYLAADPSKVYSSFNLPPGWAVFATLHEATTALGFITNDYWMVQGNVPAGLSEKLKAYQKTLIQLKNLILLTVFIGHSGLKLKAVDTIHFPINVNLNIEWIITPVDTYYVTFTGKAENSTENLMSKFAAAISLQVL